MRPQFTAPGEDALFVKVDGFAVPAGTIGKRVSEYFSQAGIRKDVHVTATNIRKMVSDKAYEMSPTKKQLIHHHMKHQERTVNANYIIKLNADCASRAHALVNDIIHESGDSAPKHQALSPHSCSNDDDDDVSLGVVFAGTTASTLNTQWETPSSLSVEHKSGLLTVFQTESSAGKILTLQEIRTRMRTNQVLRNFVVQPDVVKQIADFVRHKTNSTRQLQLTNFPDLDPDDGVASFSIESGLRKVWSPHDVVVIEAKFKGVKKVPPKREILSTFQQDPVLSHILDREGETRYYEKVKTLLQHSGQ